MPYGVGFSRTLISIKLSEESTPSTLPIFSDITSCISASVLAYAVINTSNLPVTSDIFLTPSICKSEEKIIEKFTVTIDDRKLGYDVKSLIGVNMNSKMHESVATSLLQIDGVRKISEVTGRFDVLITAYAKTLAEMHDVISEKIGKVDGVLSSESFIEMSVRENPTPYGKV